MSGEEADVSDWLIEAAGEDDIERARNYRNFDGETFFNCSEPLHLAAQGGFFNICKFLIEKRGFDVKKRNSYGESPLDLACDFIFQRDEGERLKIVKLMLDHGADISVSDPLREGETLLHAAADGGCEVLARNLLAAGVDVDVLSGDGSTPLHYACAAGRNNVVQVLCQSNANVNARNQEGWSPLHKAAYWADGKFAESIETLLKFGSNVDAQGVNMETALHCSDPETEKIAILLLDGGCDINIETSSGKTALDTVIARAKYMGDDDDYDEDYEKMTKIFCGIDNGNDDDDFQPDEFPTVVILKQHLVKLKTAELFVSQKNLSLLDSDDFSDYENQCREEVAAAQNEELLPGITLYDILSGGVNPIYAKNKPLIRALKRFNWNSFPLYKCIILNNVKKSKLRHDLLESAEKWLRMLLRTSNILNEFLVPAKIMSGEILSMIVSFLSNEELKKLITCGEELRCQLVRSPSDTGSSTP